jgi:multiple antibiotic resistance protein
MVAFGFSGQFLFKFLGISVDSFRMVGGIIFFMMGYDMLQARLASAKFNKDEERKEYVNDISITPLAIPMICGPGAITNAIVLMEDASDPIFKGILVLVMALVCILTFLILWSANKVTKWLGETGNKIMMRLMGLIVMVIAVEFFFSGLKPILISILHSA